MFDPRLKKEKEREEEEERERAFGVAVGTSQALAAQSKQIEFIYFDSRI
jgi:hypothetical protein